MDRNQTTAVSLQLLPMTDEPEIVTLAFVPIAAGKPKRSTYQSASGEGCAEGELRAVEPRRVRAVRHLERSCS